MSDACPRCGQDNAGLDACPKCGLARAHRDKLAAQALPPELEAEWQAVAAKWDEPGLHALFIEHCSGAGMLHLAAAKYRPFCADEKRAERAKKSLDRIVSLAQAALALDATPPSTVQRNKNIALVIAAIVFIALVVAMAVGMLSK